MNYAVYEKIAPEANRSGFWKQTWLGPSFDRAIRFAQAPLTDAGYTRETYVLVTEGALPTTLPLPALPTTLQPYVIRYFKERIPRAAELEN